LIVIRYWTSILPSLSLQEIEETLRKADPQKRHQTLRALTDLFLSGASNFDEKKVELFDDVFQALLDDSERSEIVDVSRRMAPVENAPRRLIKRLASDREISIAGPVLRQSPRLTEEDLCEIARSKGNSHMLAISMRKGLTEPVTDILISQGDRAVAKTVANNNSAKLSQDGLKQLLERAETDKSISAEVYARMDISPDLLKAALTKAAKRADEKAVRIASAQRLVVSLKQAGELGETEIKAFAGGQKYEELIAALALLSNLKFHTVENMMCPQRAAGIVLVCKALSFTWTTVDTVLVLAKARNSISAEEIEQAHRDFVNLSRETAERIVRFWHVRQSVTSM
jgi:uncharacterized protein (DUF2336 family)